MSDNLIPVADVTDEEKQEAAWLDTHARASSSVTDALSTTRPFVFVALAEDGTRVTALVDREGLEYAAISVLTTLGKDLLNGGAKHLPEELANNIELAAALGHIQHKLQAMTAPHTPATDAGADSKH